MIIFIVNFAEKKGANALINEMARERGLRATRIARVRSLEHEDEKEVDIMWN